MTLRRLVLAAGLVLLAGCSSPEQRSEAHYQSGLKLMAEADYVRAALEFRNAVKYDAGSIDAWSNLAAVEEKNGKPEAAAEALRHVVELAPGRDAEQEKLARILLGGNDLQAALAHADAAIAVRSSDASLLALRAAINLRRNDSDAARRDAGRALAIDPKSAEAEAVLATDLLVRGDRTNALLHANRGLAADPKNAGLLLLAIKVQESLGDDKGLESALRALAAAHPDFPQARQSLLSFLLSRHRVADAETEFRNMIKAAPGDTGVGIAFAWFLHDVRGNAAGREELTRLLAAKPKDPDVILALAQFDFASGNAAAATQRLTALIADPVSPEASNRARLLLASIQIKQRNADQASENVAKVLEADSHNADALSLRAELRIAAGDAEGAIADIRTALVERPQSAPLLTMLAEAEERIGRGDLADSDFANALKASGNAPATALGYAAFLERRGRQELASRVLREALQTNPGDTALLMTVAERELDSGDWASAERRATALASAGAETSADQIRAASLSAQGRFDESIALFRKAHDAAPGDALALNNLVQAYAKAGRIGDAETLLDEEIALRPGNAAALVLKGMIAEKRGDAGEAARNFQKAAEAQPQEPSAHLALASLRSAARQFDEAEAVLKNAHARLPADLDITLALAALYERRGASADAIALYEQQLAATPDALLAVNNLASLLAESRDDAASLDRAASLSARLNGIAVPQFKDTLGWIAYRRGDLEAAKSLLTEAVRGGGLATAHYHLGMTYQALKRSPEAEEQFRAAEALLADGDPLKKRIADARQTDIAKNEATGG